MASVVPSNPKVQSEIEKKQTNQSQYFIIKKKLRILDRLLVANTTIWCTFAEPIKES